MINMAVFGKILIISGIVLIVVGVIVIVGNNRFGWFGNLPGDIKIEKKNFSFYAPVVTMLIISIVLSLLFWIFGKIIK